MLLAKTHVCAAFCRGRILDVLGVANLTISGRAKFLVGVCYAQKNRTMPGGKKGATSSKSAAQAPAATNHTAGKDAATKTKQFSWIIVSKGAGASKATGTKGKKYATEHSIRYYVFNMHKDVSAVGIVVYGERNPKLTSWLSKILDDCVRQETSDFDPLPFHNGTFQLHHEDGTPVLNDRN